MKFSVIGENLLLVAGFERYGGLVGGVLCFNDLGGMCKVWYAVCMCGVVIIFSIFGGKI